MSAKLVAAVASLVPDHQAIRRRARGFLRRLFDIRQGREPEPSEADIKITRELSRAGPAGHYLTSLPFTVRVVRVFRGSKRLRGDVAAEMRAIELDALHGGIGCGLGGAYLVREKAPFPVRFLTRRLTCNE